MPSEATSLPMSVENALATGVSRAARSSPALRAAGSAQLSDVRAAAEKWIAGVTALFGLFGLAGLITARSTLTDLGTAWEAAVAVAAAAAIALAGLAVYRIYRAAYGWPVTSPITNNDELLSWYTAQQATPRLAAGYLRDGVRTAAAALAMLVVAAGLLLFAPESSPSLSDVQVTLTGGSQVCGTLLSTTPGVTLIRRASDGTAIEINPRTIMAETVVAAC